MTANDGTKTTEDHGRGKDIFIQVRTESVEFTPPVGELRLEHGGILKRLEIAFERYGTLSGSGDNAVYICHPLTGDAHVAGKHDISDRKPGWWNDMIGPGKGIDTDFYQVICSNILGGCEGTTGPASTNPDTGKPYGASFPEITVADMVAVQRMFLEHLGIKHLRAVIGGSLGGMQVLEWGVRHSDMVDRCICIASGASLSTQALAFDVVAKDAIMSDPAWKGGNYYETDGFPRWGLGHARKIGHITYLSPEIMQKKFGREKTSSESPEEGNKPGFQVESYLNYQANKLVERFDANSYLRITGAMDSFDLAAQFGSLDRAFDNVKSNFLVIALSSDWLFPPEQSAELASALLRAGKDVSFCTLQAPYGHDAFLIDIRHLGEVVRAFLPWVKLEGATTPSSTTDTETTEHKAIRQMVATDARVLDLGCGRGDLLSMLTKQKHTTGMGIDIDLDNFTEVIEKGHNIFQADLDKGLAVIPDGSYDYAILSSTIQVVKRPRLVLAEMVRVAREGIVSFPNFANWRNRLRLGLTGRMPASDPPAHEWYDTPDIRLTTLIDFLRLCRREHITITDMVCIPEGPVDRALLKLGRCNLGASRIVAKVTRDKTLAASPVTCRSAGCR